MPSTRSTDSQMVYPDPFRAVVRDQHDNGFLARTYPLFLFATVFVLILAVVV